MYLPDQTWLPFSNLIRNRVYNVLLVCSDYDRFMLEEDGRVEEELYHEYTELGLSSPPKITHTNSEERAQELLRENRFQLVITMLDLGSDRVEALAESVKSLFPEMPVIALSPSPDHRKARELRGENCPYIDNLFYWQGSSSIFLAMIKLVEDRMNLLNDTLNENVPCILLVEDSVRFISSYLPKLYTELIRQTRSSIKEGLNEWGKTLRMRGRPKVILKKNFTEAWDFYQEFRTHILGVITDVSYPSPMGRERSGLELAKKIKQVNPECPVLVQSTEKRHMDEAIAMGCNFTWKLSDTTEADLRLYFEKDYGFGAFRFIDPATGTVIATATNMKEVQHTMKTIPIESFIYHSKRNDFSRWMRSQSLYNLAKTIKPIVLKEDSDPEEVRMLLYRTIKNYRAERTRGSIAEFSKTNYDDTLFFSRMGKGSLGGKGRGLAFIAMEMKANKMQEKYPDIYLSIPRTVVISTEFFDKFIALNNLENLEFVNLPDKEILNLFINGKLPEDLVENLKEILEFVTAPMSVRSSSLLEDSHYQPFAGVYQTSMIANTGSHEKRFKELETAIKTVWASTYFEEAREYLKSTGHKLDEEKMAVILQQVTGSKHDNMWFPNISGVARSLNYYPTEGQKAEDGVGKLAIGFGKAVVDDGSAFRFCPAKPKKPCNNLSQNSSSQKNFYALNLDQEFSPYSNSDNLITLSVDWLKNHPAAMKGIFSTIEPFTGSLNESPRAEGIKIITFNGMLKYDMFPLAPVVDDILKIGAEAMAKPVEIEFAINTERSGDKKPDFSILQIRPITYGSDSSDVIITDEDREKAIVYAKRVLGNGNANGVKDIISIIPEAFSPSEMKEMALELEKLNKNIDAPYVLIASGRIGSSDPWLGIPCSWSQISKVQAIVETSSENLKVEPSEGTHFFQNMTSRGCFYLTVNPTIDGGFFSYDRLSKMTVIEKTKHFIHVRADKALIIKANGLKHEAIIKEDD